MKALNPLKAPFGKDKFSRIRSVSYHQWEDAFDVVFDDGPAFLEPHATIRKANKIAREAIIQSVERDEELHSGFYVYYENSQTAGVSWAFIREPPTKPAPSGGNVVNITENVGKYATEPSGASEVDPGNWAGG